MPLHPKHEGNETHTLRSISTDDEFPDEEQVRNVYHFVYRCVGNREEAEELTERSFSRALRAVQGTALSKREMTEILRRSAVAAVEEYLAECYCSSTHAHDVAAFVKLAEAEVWQSEQAGTADSIGGILAQLSADDRDVLTYRFLRNASLAEMAAQMHVSLAEAMALQWSALQNAAQCMAPARMILPARHARPLEGVSAVQPAAREAFEDGAAAECAERAPCAP